MHIDRLNNEAPTNAKPRKSVEPVLFLRLKRYKDAVDESIKLEILITEK